MTDITDIIVGINDFLVVIDTVPGFLFLSQNGGVNLMLKSVVNDDKYLLKRFFNAIEDVPAVNKIQHTYYYNDFVIPPVLVDHLLDKDTDENMLEKIKKHLNETASWMERKGLLTIADMTFGHKIGTKYRIYNKENMRLIEQLSENYTIHMLGNCSRKSLDQLIDKDNSIYDHVKGNIVTSTDLSDLQCSQTGRYDIYHKFMESYNIDPTKTLFIETQPGHIKALEQYSKYIGQPIRTILYQGGKNKKKFVSELSELLGIDIDFQYIKNNK